MSETLEQYRKNPEQVETTLEMSNFKEEGGLTVNFLRLLCQPLEQYKTIYLHT